MELLQAAHIASLSAWAGVKSAELVVEVLGRQGRTRYAAARIHMGINAFFEAPLLVAITATGVLLFRAAAETSALLWAVMLCGAVAVALNVVASHAVVLRALRVAVSDDIDLDRHGKFTRWIFLPSFASVPFGLAALFMGGRLLAWW